MRLDVKRSDDEIEELTGIRTSHCDVARQYVLDPAVLDQLSDRE